MHSNLLYLLGQLVSCAQTCIWLYLSKWQKIIGRDKQQQQKRVGGHEGQHKLAYSKGNLAIDHFTSFLPEFLLLGTYTNKILAFPFFNMPFWPYM